MPLLLTRKRLNGIIVINVVFAGLVFLALKLLIKSEIRINFEFIGAIIAVSIITFCEFIFYAKSKQLSFKNAFTDIWNLLGGNLKVAFLFLILLVAFFYSYFLYGDQFTPANFYYAKPPANTLNSTTHGSLLSDPIDSFLPTLYLIKDELLQKGKISFWNSYSGMGFSSTEAVAAAFGYFPYWIIIFLPKSIGLLAFNLFKMFICLWGMYLFLGRLKLSQVARIAGAITFTFSGTLIVWLLWEQSSVAVFAPLLFYFADKLVERYKTRDFLFFIFILTQMLYAGMPPYVAYFGYLLGLYVIYRSLFSYGNWKTLWRALGLLILAAGISAILSLPYTASLIGSVNSNDYISHRVTDYTATFDWKVLSQLIFANYKYIRGNYNESAMYLGIFPFLALIGATLYLKKIGSIRFWFITSLLILVVIFTHVFDPVIGLIPFVNTSAKTRLVVLLMFTVSILFSFIVDLILKNKISIQLFCLISLFLFILGILKIEYLDTKFGIFFASIFIILCGLSFLPHSILHVKDPYLWNGGLCILLVFIDVLEAGINYNPYIGPFDSNLPVTDSIAYFKSECSIARCTALGTWTLFPNSSTRYQWLDIRAHSFSMTSLRMGSFMESIDPKAYASSTYVRLEQIKDTHALSLAGVKYILTDEMEETYSDIYPTAENKDKYSGVIYQGRELKQIINIPNSQLNRIDIEFTNFGEGFQPGTNQIKLILRDMASSQILAETTVDLSELTNNDYLTFRFPGIEIIPKNMYEMDITTDAPPDHPISAWVSNEKPDDRFFVEDQLSLDNQAINGVLIANFITENEGLKYIRQFNDGLYLYQNLNALGHTYLSRNIELANSDNIMESVLNESDLTKVFTEKPVNGINNVPISKNETASIVDYENDKVIIDAYVNEPAMLVLSDVYDEGWHALVNNKDTEIYLVNGLFRGVKLESGKNEVVFYYRPDKIYRYALVSIGALLILIIGLLVVDGYKKRINANALNLVNRSS